MDEPGTEIHALLEITVAHPATSHFVALDVRVTVDHDMTQQDWERLACVIWAENPDPDYPGYEVFMVRVREQRSMDDHPPPDHRSDRYDYIEISGPEDIPLPEWLTTEYMPCMDCRANMFLRWEGSRWNVTIAHDESCPTLENET